LCAIRGKYRIREKAAGPLILQQESLDLTPQFRSTPASLVEECRSALRRQSQSFSKHFLSILPRVAHSLDKARVSIPMYA
jgi:hypothetical protein